MKTVPLRLGERSYSILIGRKLLSSLGDLLRPLKLGPKILIVSNRRVASFFLSQVRETLKRTGYQIISPYLLPYGNERDKSSEVLVRLWQHMAKVGLERTSAVLALGGGVVGDVAGFAASTYMRGISLVQVPTTLLAQVDSAIGGKTAIDLPSAKNLVGTFHQPRLVVSDVETLSRMGLSASGLRELRNSFAEIIKYGMIQDARLFRLLEEKGEAFFISAAKKPLGHREFSFLETVVWRSACVKASVVEQDERETKRVRMILNYGHTFGHAFEAAKHFKLPHGEAVALGMVSAARLACQLGFLKEKNEQRQNQLIAKLGLPTSLKNYDFRLSDVMQAMLLDKKKKKGRLRFILPTAIGCVQVVENLPPSRVKSVLASLI